MELIKAKKIYKKNGEIILYEFKNNDKPTVLDNSASVLLDIKFDLSEAEIVELKDIYQGDIEVISNLYRFRVSCRKSEDDYDVFDAENLQDVLPYYNDEKYIETAYYDKRFGILFMKNNMTKTEIMIGDGKITWFKEGFDQEEWGSGEMEG